MIFDWWVCAVLHLKLYADKQFTDAGLPLKLTEIIKTFLSICEYARNKNIAKVAILGDINHTKQIASVDAFSIFKNVLESFPELVFYIIPGNHDETAKDGIRSAIDLLKGPSNIITLDKTTVIDNITFVPYNYINQINDVKLTDVLMSHFGLSDAILSNGKSIRSRIKLSDLRRWKKVFCGHYHKPQDIENFHYAGSLIPLTRAEFDEEKRFILFNSETFETESVLTEGYRKYYEFVLDDENNVDTIMDEAKELKNLGHFVHVRNRLYNQPIDNKDGINIIDEYEEEYQSRGISSKMSDSEQMSKYMEIKRVPEEEREEFLNVGLEIINH